MPAAAERPRDGGGVELRNARAADAEDPPVHLDEADERLGIREVDDLVREVRDSVDVRRPGDRRDEDLQPADGVALERCDERVEERALLLGERRAQVLRDHVLARPVAQAPGQRLGVPERDPGIAERARVLVDPEGEDGRLERRHLQLALGEDPDHRRRQRAVVGEHEVLGLDPLRRLAGMVVEDDHLDPGIAGDPLELAEALRLHRLDDDQPADRVEVEPPGLRDLELVRVQAVELAHVTVERAGERDDRARIEPPRGQHGRERVEVRVRVGDDDVHGWKVRPGRAVSPFLRMRTVALGTHGERGVRRQSVYETAHSSHRAPGAHARPRGARGKRARRAGPDRARRGRDGQRAAAVQVGARRGRRQVRVRVRRRYGLQLARPRSRTKNTRAALKLLVPNGTYYWRVRGVTSGGDVGDVVGRAQPRHGVDGAGRAARAVERRHDHVPGPRARAQMGRRPGRCEVPRQGRERPRPRNARLRRADRDGIHAVHAQRPDAARERTTGASRR